MLPNSHAFPELMGNSLLVHDISPYCCHPNAEETILLKRILRHEGTPEAIREFTRCRNRLGDYLYWFTLATLWVSYTGYSDLQLWKRLFSASRPHRAECLMKPSEYRNLQNLPELITLYRAHRPGETDWIAYTLDPMIAAGRFAVERGVNEIKAYHVQREQVLALFTRRGEKEILVLDRSQAKPAGTIEVVRQESI